METALKCQRRFWSPRLCWFNGSWTRDLALCDSYTRETRILSSQPASLLAYPSRVRSDRFFIACITTIKLSALIVWFKVQLSRRWCGSLISKSFTNYNTYRAWIRVTFSFSRPRETHSTWETKQREASPAITIFLGRSIDRMQNRGTRWRVVPRIRETRPAIRNRSLEEIIVSGPPERESRYPTFPCI